MRGVKPLGGFTIVEVLVFLAVTGGLFLIAMVAINGQEQKTEFAQGMRDLHSRIDEVINDVSDGSFPDAAGFTCTVAGGSSPKFDSLHPNDQGSNQDCVFLGKVMAFSSKANQLSHFQVYTVTGVRHDSSGNEVSDWATAQPVAVDPVTPDGGANLTDTQNMPYGIKVTKIEEIDAGHETDIGAFGAFNSFGSYDVNSNLNSTANQIVLAAVPTSSLGAGYDPGNVTQLKNLSSTDLNPDAIIICLQHSATNQKAAIIVGSHGKETNTELHIGDMVNAVNGIVGSSPC